MGLDNERQGPMAAKKKKKAKKASKKRKTTKKRTTKTKRARKSSVGKHHKAHRKAGTGYASKMQAFLKADDILKGAKRRTKRGKRWSCAGPVRSGCGGSGSKVTR
jgi:hypothetical protein